MAARWSRGLSTKPLRDNCGCPFPHEHPKTTSSQKHGATIARAGFVALIAVGILALAFHLGAAVVGLFAIAAAP